MENAAVAAGTPKALEVTIMGRKLRISCPPEQEVGLLQAVAYLDGKMREVRDAGKTVDVERIAIMTALHIAHEHLTTRVAGDVDVAQLKTRLAGLVRNIDGALAEQDKLF